LSFSSLLCSMALEADPAVCTASCLQLALGGFVQGDLAYRSEAGKKSVMPSCSFAALDQVLVCFETESYYAAQMAWNSRSS
jgi:hypothetical protein